MDAIVFNMLGILGLPLLWLRQLRYREGKVLVYWPAMDLRRDVRIADVSRLREGIIGVQVRTCGVLHRTAPPPEFGEIRYMRARDLRQAMFVPPGKELPRV